MTTINFTIFLWTLASLEFPESGDSFRRIDYSFIPWPVYTLISLLSNFISLPYKLIILPFQFDDSTLQFIFLA